MNYKKHKYKTTEDSGLKQYKLARAIGLKKPIDNHTPEEKKLEKLLTYHTIETLYQKIPTPRMKAIVALHYELQYPLELVANIFDIRVSSLQDEINIIKHCLMGRPYRSTNRKPLNIPEEEVNRILELLYRE